MNATALDDVMHPEDYLTLLTHTLAELADRLRHSADQVPAETAVPTSTPRLEAAAQMLTGATLRHELGPLASLGDGLSDFLSVLRDCPGWGRGLPLPPGPRSRSPVPPVNGEQDPQGPAQRPL